MFCVFNNIIYLWATKPSFSSNTLDNENVCIHFIDANNYIILQTNYIFEFLNICISKIQYILVFFSLPSSNSIVTL